MALEKPDLSGQTAFITGTTRGIGKAIALALALAEQGCNTFWPVTAIDTRATRHFGLGTEDDWRTPEIVSDTILEILSRDPASFSGNSVSDEELLREANIEDFSRYNLTEGDPAPGSAKLFDPEYSRLAE